MSGPAAVRTAPEAGPRSRPGPLRRPVAVLVSRFPLVTETFILREIDELERRGQPVVLVPLIRERPAVVHPEARPWVGRALFTAYLSPAVAAANLRWLVRRPLRTLGTLLRLAAGTLPSPGFLLRSLLLFPKAAYLAERLPREGVAHLHAHFATHPATVAWVVHRLSGIGFSFTAHAHDLFVDATFLGPKVRSARFVRAISRYNRRWLEERYPAARGRTAVVHMGIEPERYREAGAPDTGPPLVLSVAALKPYKGIPVLLEACDRLRRHGVELRCRVVGEGPDRPALEAEVRRRELEGVVELVGARTQHEVARLLARAHLFVLPSVVADDGQMEGLPVVLMEAAAAGRAMVAPDLSGIPELVVDGETGLLFPPGDAAALAEGIERLLADPETAERLGRRARERVEAEFRLEDTAGELLRLLDGETRAAADDDAELVRAVVGEGETVGVEAVHDGPDARVLELLTSGSGEARRLLLKVHRRRPGQSAPPAVRAAREAEVLRRLADLRSQGLPLGAPEVVRVDEARAALLLAPAAGRPLDDLLREGRRPFVAGARRRLADAGRRCGVWLRTFQERVPPPAVADPLAGWRRRIETAAETATGLSDDLRRAAGDLAAAGSELLSKEPVVARHGDLWPGNLLLDGERVSGLDFEGFGAGVPGQDAACLLLHAELYFPPPLGGRFRAFRDGVLDGLGRTPDPTLAVCRRAEALFALAAGTWRHGSPLLAPWRRRRLRRVLSSPRRGGRQ